jgi:phytoene dehydrogenase-like protein
MRANDDVLVVGGGIAGLACAALLQRGGRTVTVLEAGAAPGGLARSTVRDGFTFNRGGHALYRGGAAQEVLEVLDVEVRGTPPSLEGVAYRGGKVHRLPSAPWSLLTTGLLGWRGRGALLRLFAGIKTLQAGPESAAQWLDAYTPDPAARAFLASMLRLSTYAGDLSAIRAADAVAALRQATLHGVLYLDGGWQQLVDALSRGLTVRTRAPVEQVEPGAVTLRDGERLVAEHVVLAVPPSVAARWVPGGACAMSKVACLDVALRTRPRGPRLGFDLDDPMYAAVHSDTARLAPEGGALVHTFHYQAPTDARARLEGLLDRMLPDWRAHVVHAQFLPSITVTEGIVSPGSGGRPGVRVEGLERVWRVGDAVGDHGALADAAFGSAREVARAILGRASRQAA